MPKRGPRIRTVRSTIRRFAWIRVLCATLLLALLGGIAYLALFISRPSWHDLFRTDIRLLIINSLLVVAAVIGIGHSYWLGFTWLRDPLRHPALEIPDFGTPAEVADSLDREMQEPGGIFETKAAWFTRSWMIPRRDDWSFQIAPVSSIQWVVKYDRENRLFGMHLERVYNLWISAKGSAIVRMHELKPRDVDALLALLREFVPGVTIAYIPDFEAQMAKQPEVTLRRLREMTPSVASRRIEGPDGDRSREA